jgi:hypothetical protein
MPSYQDIEPLPVRGDSAQDRRLEFGYVWSASSGSVLTLFARRLCLRTLLVLLLEVLDLRGLRGLRCLQFLYTIQDLREDSHVLRSVRHVARSEIGVRLPVPRLAQGQRRRSSHDSRSRRAPREVGASTKKIGR